MALTIMVCLGRRRIGDGAPRAHPRRNISADAEDPVVKNNIAWQYRTAAGLYALELRDWSGTAQNVDGNLSFNQSSTTDRINALNTTGRSWAQWQAAGFDLHGANDDPALDSCYRAASASGPSVGTGQVLTADVGQGLALTMCPATVAGWAGAFALVDRSVVGGTSWDIGAFEYGTPPVADAGIADGSAADGAPADGSLEDSAVADGAIADATASEAGTPATGDGAATDSSGCSCETGAGGGGTSHLGLALMILLLLGRRHRPTTTG